MTSWHRNIGWLLAAITFVASLVFTLGPDALRMSLPASFGVSGAAAAAVWLSGRRPVTGLVVVMVLAVVLPAVRSTFEAMPLVIVLVAFQAAMNSELKRWVMVVTCFASLTVNDVWQREAFDLTYLRPSVLNPALMTALAVGLGLQSRTVRLQQQALLTLQDADKRRALSDERRRIARDVHDVAAHHLSALVVRNKLARRIHTVDALADAADFTASTARDALDSLRQVVGVLSTEGSSPLDPQPSFADIDGIVGRMHNAGLQVDRRSQDLPVASRDVEVAIVRIVQEALANVLRHRGPGRAWLDLRSRDGAVALTIEDDGPSPRPAGMIDEVWQRPGSYGLIGMRERAQTCGGELSIGRSSKGGWRVEVLVPANAQRIDSA